MRVTGLFLCVGDVVSLASPLCVTFLCGDAPSVSSDKQHLPLLPLSHRGLQSLTLAFVKTPRHAWKCELNDYFKALPVL